MSNCEGCQQPMKPAGVRKKAGEYDHAQGCPKAVEPTTIVRHDGLYQINFADGSVLRHCKKRTYKNSGVEWYLFCGVQINRKYLDSRGAQIQLEAKMGEPK